MSKSSKGGQDLEVNKSVNTHHYETNKSLSILWGKHLIKHEENIGFPFVGKLKACKVAGVYNTGLIL